MVEYLLSWGNIFLPAGLVLVIMSSDKKDGLYWGLIIGGVLFTIVGLFMMKRGYDEAVKRDAETNSINEGLKSVLKGLKEDMNTNMSVRGGAYARIKNRRKSKM